MLLNIAKFQIFTLICINFRLVFARQLSLTSSSRNNDAKRRNSAVAYSVMEKFLRVTSIRYSQQQY